MATIKALINLNNDNNTVITVGQSHIDSFSMIKQMTANPTEVNYVLVPDSGKMEITDQNGEIRRILETNTYDPNDMTFELYINGNLAETGIITDSNYDKVTNTFSISTSNMLMQLRNKTFPFTFGSSSYTLKSLLTQILLDIGFSQTEIDAQYSKSTVFKRADVVTISSYLESIILPIKFIKTSTYNDILGNICSIAQIAISISGNGSLSINTIRPVVATSQLNDVVYIPRKIIYENLNYNAIKKNNYNGVVVPYNKVVSEYREDYLINGETVTYGRNGPTSQNVGYEYYTVGLEEAQTTTNRFLYGVIKFYGKVTDSEEEYVDIADVDPYYSVYYKPAGVAREDTGTLTEYATINDFNDYLMQARNLNTVPNIIVGAIAPSIQKQETIYLVATRAQYTTNNGGYTFSDVDYQTAKFGKPTTTYKYYNDYKQTFGETSNNVELANNQLLLDNSVIGGNNLFAELAANILSDYQNGSYASEITICCYDLYNRNGVKVVDWTNNGETIDLGTVIQISNDTNSIGTQRYWMVVGKELQFESGYYLKLQLQELNLFYVAGLYKNGILVKSYSELIGDGIFTLTDGELMCNDTLDGDLELSPVKDITSLAYRAFYSFPELSSVRLPDTVTSIGAQCFRDDSLRYLNIPKNVTILGNVAFRDIYCETLEYNATNASDIAYNKTPFNDSYVGDFIIGDNVERIPAYLASSSDSLHDNTISNLTIGSGVTYIASRAFYENLRIVNSITCKALTPPTLELAVEFSNTSCPIYVPSGSVNAYKTASGWSNYASRIQAISEN